LTAPPPSPPSSLLLSFHPTMDNMRWMDGWMGEQQQQQLWAVSTHTRGNKGRHTQLTCWKVLGNNYPRNNFSFFFFFDFDFDLA
jgi:hypothetical protein